MGFEVDSVLDPWYGVRREELCKETCKKKGDEPFIHRGLRELCADDGTQTKYISRVGL